MSVKCIFTQQAVTVEDNSMKVSKITVTTPPDKVNYNAGESFDPTGMVVEATYVIGNVVVADHIPITRYQCSPSILAENTTEVKITYSEGGITVETNVPVTVIVPWSWGSETDTVDDIGDADWWAGLREFVLTASTDELANCLGKTKYVILSSPVRSVTGHLVRCIGYNLDGNQTLTFQTDTCFLDSNTANNYFCTDSEYSTFGSQALWTDGINDSQARRQCKDYYNYFPGKDSIKTVPKRYLSRQFSSNSMHDTACDKAYSETVFLPSENEMGWKGTGSASSSVGYSKANNEVCTMNIGVEPYQYYTDNSKRIKKAQGTDSNAGSNWYYWERSHYYRSSNPDGVCRVNNNGTANFYGYNYSYGLAPAFVIG